MLFVYVTDECRKDAERFGWKSSLESLVRNVEKCQSTTSFDAFPIPYFVKKKFGSKQGRLIAAEKLVEIGKEKHNVLVLLKILTRSSNEYDGVNGFGHDPMGYGKRNLDPTFNALDCESFVVRRLSEETTLPKPKPKMTEGEQLFLNTQRAGSVSDDKMLCESKKWVDEAVKHEDLLPRLRDQIYEILELGCDETICGVPQLVKVKEREDYSIAYQWLEDGKRLFLYDLVEDGRDPDGAIPAEKRNEVQKYLYREYPDWMLLDDKMWIDLEKDKFGNFSLSPEESRILHPEEGELRFPLFINGRAGSGKSTVLQYIYADYISRYVGVGESAGKPPAYFACNGELIGTAKDLVRSILLHNPKYCDGTSAAAIQEFVSDSKKFEKPFHVYHEYLLSLVDQTARNSLFPSRRYLDYARFAKKWEEKFSKTPNAMRDYGVDISWHVIRTYIKGMSMDGFLEELSDYENIPKNQQSVLPKEFETVFKNVWEAWYQNLTDPENGEGYWDDQDLVRYVLDNDLLPHDGNGFLGVFCDESQDFTHIELESFLRMSVYFERTIYPHEISKLPFAFAGDPYQTLNPTGFRWEAVKASFTEKFIFGICPIADKVKTDYFTLADLQNNYRSIPNIVRFGNSVQMLRSAKFQIPDLKPQIEWKADVARPVSYFPADDEHFWKEMLAREGAHIIVPCHAGEELQFVEQDDVLKKHVEIDKEKNTTKPPVFSAVRAKGLEFPCVIVYGFGRSLRDGKLIDLQDKAAETESAKFLPYEYFLNRLYVAVSRPRTQLYVVDTQEGRDNLWRFAESPEALKLIQQAAPHGQVWSEHLEPLREGTAEHLNSDFEYNPEELAEKFEKTGLAEKDPAMMNYAARYYQECKGKNDKVVECEAMALLFGKDYAGAAKKFTDIKNYTKAGDCWWECGDANGWKKMEDLSAHDPKLRSDSRYAVARALAEGKAEDASAALGNLLKKVREDGAEQFQSEKWVAAATALANIATSGNGTALNGAMESVLGLVEEGVCESSEKFAEAMLNNGELQLARRFYEAAGISTGARYKRTMFVTTDYPERLSYFDAENPETVKETIGLFQQNAEVELTENAWRFAVSAAFAKENRIAEVAGMLAGIGDHAMLRALSGMTSDSDWKGKLQDAADIANLRTQSSENVVQAAVLNFKNDANVWFWVRMLARVASDKSIKLESGVQDYLRGNLRSLAQSWQKTALTAQERERLVPSGEFGFVLEKFGQFRDAAGFYKWHYGQTKNRRSARRWLDLQMAKLDLTHGKEASDLRSKITDFAREAGMPPSSGGVESVSFDWDSLLADLFAKQVPAETTRDSDETASVEMDAPVQAVAAESESESTTAEMAQNPETATQAATARPAPEPAAEMSPEPAAGEIPGAPALKLTFFAAKGRLNIEDQESGSQWNITANGVSVDGEAKGHVSKMKIEGTSFSVSTSQTQIVFSDDRCGYEFTIKLP